MKSIEKKLIGLFITSLIAFSTFAVDLQLKVIPYYNIPIKNTAFDSSFGIGASFDVSPFTVRQRDNINLSFQINDVFLGNKSLSKGNVNLLSGEFGVGYDFRFHDRFSVMAEGLFGIWTANNTAEIFANTEKSTSNSGEKKETDCSGISAGGRVSFNYYINPAWTAGAFVAFKSYIYNPKPLLNAVQPGIFVRYNFTKGLFATSGVTETTFETKPLFPVFYSYYNDHDFGSITFVNAEKNKIKNVNVSVYIERYMANPSVVQTFDELDIGEEFTVDMTAFLNESILNNVMYSISDAKITVDYTSLGKKMQYSKIIELQTLGRNNMSWEEDERAAAFVSGRDASANKFARLVQIVAKEKLGTGESENTVYARAIHAALKAYGLNYVVDPASSFTENIGTASIDFLQFPYQTLLFHSGDCDDLTILYTSLMEALNIETAFITVPGHIFMAYDAGILPEDVTNLPDKYYIIKNNTVWIPVEVTMCQDSFAEAKRIGYSEYTQNGSDAFLIPVHEAWKKYGPVSIPESDIDFELPARKKILDNY